MASSKRVNNRGIRACVDRRMLFKNNNGTVYSEWHDGPCGRDTIYVVYSYGNHFPLYVYDVQTQQWYGNKDKYSPTTSRHQTQARPSEHIAHWFDTDALKEVSYFGLAGAVDQRMNRDKNHELARFFRQSYSAAAIINDATI